jgi:hypothetical protein
MDDIREGYGRNAIASNKRIGNWMQDSNLVSGEDSKMTQTETPLCAKAACIRFWFSLTIRASYEVD